MDPEIASLAAKNPTILKQITRRQRKPLYDVDKQALEVAKLKLKNVGRMRLTEEQILTQEQQETDGLKAEVAAIEDRISEELAAGGTEAAGDLRRKLNTKKLELANQQAMLVANAQARRNERITDPAPAPVAEPQPDAGEEQAKADADAVEAIVAQAQESGEVSAVSATDQAAAEAVTVQQSAKEEKAEEKAEEKELKAEVKDLKRELKAEAKELKDEAKGK